MSGNSPFLTQSNSHLAWCQSEPQINEWAFLYILLSGLVFEVINLDICNSMPLVRRGLLYLSLSIRKFYCGILLIK